MDKWVIFDADNTLWNVEALYDEAREKMCQQVSGLCDTTSKDIEKHQREFDAKLKSSYGYSAHRFARSFEDTFKHFVDDASDVQVLETRKHAEKVFYSKAEVFPRLEEVLRCLRANGYALGLVTAGEEWVQRRRLDEFHLLPLFRAVKVVETKTQEELEQFCDDNKVDRSNSYFVGDSVDSDIIPSFEAGLQPVLLREHHHWIEGETKKVPPGVQCEELEFVADLLTFLQLQPGDSQRVPRRVPAFAIFEGGGAKGLAHIGVLKILEERKFDVKRVAGTSAGAIMAGLCAVGYKADDLFDPDAQNQGILDYDYLEDLGEDEWFRAEQFIQDVTARLTALTDPNSGALQGVGRWLSFGRYLRDQREFLTALNNGNGYFNLDSFRDRYDGWLKDRLLQTDGLAEDHQGPVLFEDIPIDLYIVSTDLAGKKLRVHSKEMDVTESVADAVAASIAIPGVFQPRYLSKSGMDSLHVDGGMLSNFPAWLFATPPLRMDPGQTFTPIFGVELQDSEESLGIMPQGLFALSKDLVSTAIAGSKKLETRDLRRLLQISVPVSVKSYQFRMNPEQRLETYRQGQRAAKRFFKSNIHAVSPMLMRPYLQHAHARMLTALEGQTSRKSLHLRVNVMARIPPDELARQSDWPESQQTEILYHENMDVDPDVIIAFGPEEGGVGKCYTFRESQVIDLEWTRQAYPIFRMTAVQQALVRRSLKSLLCVPIFDPNDPEITESTQILGTLNFDSDDDVLDLFGRYDVKKFAMELAEDLAVVWCDLAEHGEVHNG